MIMLLLVTIGLLILISIFSLHYYRHFHLRCSCSPNAPPFQTNGSNSSIFGTEINIINAVKRKQLCCVLIPHGGEKYNLFPYSFLFYLAFMALLCIFIVITEFADFFYYANTNNETVTDLFLGYSIESYRNNSIGKLHQINGVRVMDYMLIYGVMLSCVWESSFSFYRYYTMFIGAHELRTVSSKKVMKKFLVYAIIFCIIFILQIHVTFWIFPVIILLFFSFNTYCCYSFSSMLLARCNFFADLGDDTNTNQDITKSVLLTRKISLITCVLQSVYLGLFLIGYNIDIIYYLPILWSITSFTLALNFVRNRQFLTTQNFLCIKNAKANSVRDVIVHSCKSTLADEKDNIANGKLQVIKPVNSAETEIVSDTQYVKFNDQAPAKTKTTDDIDLTNTVPQTQLGTSKSLDTLMDEHKQIKQPPLFRPHTDPETISEINISNTNLTKKRDSKSQRLLGLTEIRTENLQVYDENHQRQTRISVSRSNNKALKLLGVNTMSKARKSTMSITAESKQSKQSKQSKYPKISYINMEEESDHTLKMEQEDNVFNTPLPMSVDSPMDIQKMPAVITPVNDDNITNNYKNSPLYSNNMLLDDIDERKVTIENETAFKYVVDANAHEKKYDESMISVNIQDKIHSVEAAVDFDVEHDMDEVFNCLSVTLAESGFCPKASINSAKQLSLYQRKTSVVGSPKEHE